MVEQLNSILIQEPWSLKQLDMVLKKYNNSKLGGY